MMVVILWISVSIDLKSHGINLVWESRAILLMVRENDVYLLTCMHSNSLFTRPKRTRQDCLVCVGGVNTTADKTRQFCLVLT